MVQQVVLDTNARFYSVSMSDGLKEVLCELDGLSLAFYESFTETTVLDKGTVFEVMEGFRPDVWERIYAGLKIRWTVESNAIEGSQLNSQQTQFLLDDAGRGRVTAGTCDEAAAINHHDAIEFMMGVLSDKQPITTSLIKEINALLLRGVESTPAINSQGKKVKKPANPGKYKISCNHVKQVDGMTHKYVDPIHVALQMEELVGWINDQTGRLNPLIIAAIAHYNFVRIHPFDDGNGRGARLLMNLILFRSKHIPAVIEAHRASEYYATLQQADEGDLAPFIMFIVGSEISTAREVMRDFVQAQNES